MAPPLLPSKADDWAYIQAQYELAEKSVPQLSKETGVPAQRIFAVANRNGWERAQDPQEAAQKRAELRLAREELEASTLQEAKELAVRVNSEMQYQMLATHRTDIGKARDLSMKLFDELKTMMENAPALLSLGAAMRSEDDRGRDKQNDIYHAIIGFAGRVDALKKLSEVAKNLILLERQAYGVSSLLEDPEKPQATTPTEDAMADILDKFNVVMTAKTNVQPLPMADVVENDPARVD